MNRRAGTLLSTIGMAVALVLVPGAGGARRAGCTAGLGSTTVNAGHLGVLEIGCGPGAAARAIADRPTTGHVLVVDRSAAAIRQPTARSAEQITAGRASARQVAIEDLVLAADEEPFDLVVAIPVGALDGRPPRAAGAPSPGSRSRPARTPACPSTAVTRSANWPSPGRGGAAPADTSAAGARRRDGAGRPDRDHRRTARRRPAPTAAGRIPAVPEHGARRRGHGSANVHLRDENRFPNVSGREDVRSQKGRRPMLARYRSGSDPGR